MNGHPRNRGLRLDGPVGQFRRAVDWLHAATVHTPLDHQPASPPRPPCRRRQVPGDGQAALLKEAS